jgi:DNA-binding NarL/FixJ family response regulator
LAPDPEERADDDTIRTVVVDAHPALRRSVRMLLDGEADVEVVAEAGDPLATRRQVLDQLPDVLVLDLGMHGEAGTDTIRGVRAAAPHTAVVAMTMNPSRARATAALDAGAIGFVLKQNADGELPAAFRCAARGESYVSPQVRSV